jgi:hypothetical protein
VLKEEEEEEEDVAVVLLGTDHPLKWESDGEGGWHPPSPSSSSQELSPDVKSGGEKGGDSGIVSSHILGESSGGAGSGCTRAGDKDDDDNHSNNVSDSSSSSNIGDGIDSDSSASSPSPPVTEFVLGNGLKFTYRVNLDYLDDEVLVHGVAVGGTSECVPLVMDNKKRLFGSTTSSSSNESSDSFRNDFATKEREENEEPAATSAENEKQEEQEKDLSSEVRKVLFSSSYACHVASEFGVLGLPKEQVKVEVGVMVG